MDHTSEQNQIFKKITVNWSGTKILTKPLLPLFPRNRDVSTGVTGTTAAPLAPKLKIVITKNTNC